MVFVAPPTTFQPSDLKPNDVESTVFYDNCWLVSHCWANRWKGAAGGVGEQMGRRAEGKEKTKVWGRRLSPRASICFHFVPASAGRTLWNNGDTDSDESESGSAGKVVKRFLATLHRHGGDDGSGNEAASASSASAESALNPNRDQNLDLNGPVLLVLLLTSSSVGRLFLKWK
uniref:HDC09922 n=1 Tax=Drosophila melanogaster TaxID=7227 RepID=Q6ILA5_DROME|nr:TPA_inf: HDC09922 [Drosophila melanogaster]